MSFPLPASRWSSPPHPPRRSFPSPPTACWRPHRRPVGRYRFAKDFFDVADRVFRNAAHRHRHGIRALEHHLDCGRLLAEIRRVLASSPLSVSRPAPPPSVSLPAPPTSVSPPGPPIRVSSPDSPVETVLQVVAAQRVAGRAAKDGEVADRVFRHASDCRHDCIRAVERASTAVVLSRKSTMSRPAPPSSVSVPTRRRTGCPAGRRSARRRRNRQRSSRCCGSCPRPPHRPSQSHRMRG